MLVSVIIPCYNVEKYIEECIASVLSQSYRQLEIICIDDGSTDNTYHLLQRFEHQIQIIKTKNNGASYARNLGVAAAKGTYLQFLDADDLLMPDKISANIRLIEAAQQSNIIAASNDDYMVIGAHIHQHPDGKQVKYSYAKDKWMSVISFTWGNTCCNLWSAALVRKAGGFDESLTCYQDGDILFRIAMICDHVLYDPNYNTIIRERSGSISTTRHNTQLNEQRLINSINIRSNMRAYLLNAEKYNSFYEQALDHHLFLHIKDFAFSDTHKAFYYHQQHIPARFTPSLHGLSWFYILNYKLGGFNFAEKMGRLVHKIKGRI